MILYTPIGSVLKLRNCFGAHDDFNNSIADGVDDVDEDMMMSKFFFKVNEEHDSNESEIKQELSNNPSRNRDLYTLDQSDFLWWGYTRLNTINHSSKIYDHIKIYDPQMKKNQDHFSFTRNILNMLKHDQPGSFNGQNFMIS